MVDKFSRQALMAMVFGMASSGMKAAPAMQRLPSFTAGVSKYRPHQGAQEKARRVRQIARGIIAADQVHRVSK